jgi:putative transposase
LALIEANPQNQIPLAWQADLLSLSRASLYYRPRPLRDQEVRIKHRLDELYTAHPFLGSRKIVRILAGQDITVGRHTIRRFRQEMGLETLFAKPHVSQPGGSPHRVYPYLLRGLVIERPNQVWGVDITYIRLSGGWMYLVHACVNVVAFLDWYSRYVVAWELSDSLEIDFVLACMESALSVAIPQIVNSDQGSHFTSERFTGRLQSVGAQISMDGRGRCMDNIFTERLWRSVKYEEVYLSEYESPRAARRGLSRYLSFYNEGRPHQALGYKTPSQVYAEPACLKGRKDSLKRGQVVS